MKPIPFYLVTRREVERLTRHAPVPASLLDSYLACRPGILSDDGADIFCQNCRSEGQRWTAFELFERVETPGPGVLIVFPTWLELFLSGEVRPNIKRCIDWAIARYPSNPITFQWNHDIDAATLTEFDNLPANVFILQFNTSRVRPNDILLPFWTIDTNRPRVEKRWKAGFCGYVGGIEVRQRLAKAIRNREREGYFFSRDRIPEDQWLELLGSFWFSLCPRGGGLSSYRYFQSIQAGSIPVLFGDDAKLPFPDLDYSRFSLKFPEHGAADFSGIDSLLANANREELSRGVEGVKERFSLAGVQKAIYERLQGHI